MEPRWCSARRWSLGSGGLMPATVSIMPTFEELDAITLADLQATGATKWSRGSDLIGAFVAEMDFGIAAPITRRLHREVDRAAFGYLPRDLKAEMREATTAFLRERTGWEVDPRDVHEMPDVIAVLQAVMDSFTRPARRSSSPLRRTCRSCRCPDWGAAR